jgi:hypothetical protein
MQGFDADCRIPEEFKKAGITVLPGAASIFILEGGRLVL